MLKTTLLMGLMTALLLVIGDYIGGSSGMTVMLAFSLISNVLLYWYSDKLVIAQYDARPVDAGSAPQLYGIVQSLARRAQLPMPRVYVVDTALPNAFATGRNPEHAAVCVTTGLMEMLTPREVAGVLGHEMSHVKHNDILISTIAAGMAGIISVMARFAFWFGGDRDDRRNNPLAGILMLVLTPLAAAVIQLAISRTREYMADFTGGQLSGDGCLADALERSKGMPVPGPCPGPRKPRPICSSFLRSLPKMPRPFSVPIRPPKSGSNACARRPRKCAAGA